MITTQYSDETLLDFVLRTYGDVKYVVNYLKSSQLNSYDAFETGSTITRPLLEIEEPVVIEFIKDERLEDQPFMTSITHHDETLFDVLLNRYGDLNKFLEIMKDMGLKSTSDLTPGIEFVHYRYDTNFGYFLSKNQTEVRTWSDITTLDQIEVLGAFSNDFGNDFDI